MTISTTEAQNQLIKALTRFSDLPPEAGLPESVRPKTEAVGTAFYRFSTGEFHWVFPAEQRAEAFSGLSIAPIPGSDELLVGLAQIRGELTPIYQLHARLGQALPIRSKTLVFHLDGAMVGLLVDALPERQWLTPSNVTDESPFDEKTDVVSALISGVARDGERYLIQLAVEHLGSALRDLASTERRTHTAGPRPSIPEHL
ncbi:chemotaxis protein CheW [Marinimicrobium agarilyticum]|uniref:chemotaxis protein CheW n=1 Tax=Marinimicrobium agarilyticum TaxID=306546 RepID=UPI0004044925|nr:chemotaxis protein CheW [Marinimicrobium agarilyticum]